MVGRFPLEVWLSVLAVASLCVAVSAAILIVPGWRKRPVTASLRWSLLAIVLMLATELSGDVVRQMAVALIPWMQLLIAGALIAICLSMTGAMGGQGLATRLATRLGGRWGKPLVLLGVSLSLAIGVQWRVSHSFRAAELEMTATNLVEDSIRPLLTAEGVFAVTDAGRRIELELLGESTKLTDVEERVPEKYRSRVIIDETSELPSNCHGWVFTGGKYLIRGRFVDMILRDNGYEVVTEPAPGDLIIYRNEMGAPLHTGIVKAVGENGFLLIESKWGALDTYLHLPNDQVYSQGYAYYRSPRPTHLLKVITGRQI